MRGFVLLRTKRRAATLIDVRHLLSPEVDTEKRAKVTILSRNAQNGPVLAS